MTNSKQCMQIVFIGAGNLATNLATALKKAGHIIKQVYSKTEKSASALGIFLQCPHTSNIKQIERNADLYIVALKDSILQEVANEIIKGREGSLWVHTSGSTEMDVLNCERRGVFYPMQTFSKTRIIDFATIPCFLEANKDEDLETLKYLANSISSNVSVVSSSDRKYLHLSAVFCCNFVNHTIAIGEKLLRVHGIDFKVMLPLIEETIKKLNDLSPIEAQTGPAIRWDENIMMKHKELLSEDHVLQNIYDIFSKNIHIYSQNND